MISCSPTSSDTAAHNLDTASNPSSQSHFTKDIPRKITKDTSFDLLILHHFPNSGLNLLKGAGFCREN
jgi:hypothetical protein